MLQPNPARCPPTSPRRSAFTLVELLVVIGIIALLISILLPALNRARFQAQYTVCAESERQFVLAVQMYANENKGYLPRHDYGTTGRNLPTISPVFHDLFRTSYQLPQASFFCPTAPEYLTDTFWNYFGYIVLPGYSWWVPRLDGGIFVPPNPGDPGFTVVDTQIFRGPARIGEKTANTHPVWTDAVMTYTRPPNDDLSRYDTAGTPSPYFWPHIWKNKVHGINAAYLDGHVEFVPVGDVKVRY